MKDPLEYVDGLAARARTEIAPQGDVSRIVSLRLRERENSLSGPMLVFTAGYAAAASAALAYGFSIFNAINHPLSSIFQTAAAMIP